MGLSLSRKRLSIIAIFAVVLISVVLNASFFVKHLMFVTTNSIKDANELTELTAFVINSNRVEEFGLVVRFVLATLLPLALLLVSNAALICRLVQIRRKQLRIRSVREFHQENRSFCTRCWCYCWFFSANRHLRTSRNNIALMVFAVELMHILFASPSIGLSIFVLFAGQEAVSTSGWLILASNISNILVFVHCSIDWFVFVLYQIIN